MVRLGAPIGVVSDAGPEDQGAVHRQRLRLRHPPAAARAAGRAGDHGRPEAHRGAVLHALSHRRSLALLPGAANDRAGPRAARAARQFLGAPRTRPGSSAGAADRAAHRDRRHHQERSRGQGAAARHRNRRSALPSRRPAARDQPGDLRSHEIRASARGQGTARAGLRMGAANPGARRPRSHRPALGSAARRHHQSRRRRRRSQPPARRLLQPGSEVLSILSRVADLPSGPRQFRPDAGAFARRRFPARPEGRSPRGHRYVGSPVAPSAKPVGSAP